MEKGQVASCRAISWLGGRSRKVRKVGSHRGVERIRDWKAVRQHVEVGVKEGMRETGRKRRAARRVVAGASIEADMIKCVRVYWGR